MLQNNDETLEDVINDGIMFLGSLTRHYGAERAMEVWETMNKCLGTEVMGQVFFKMITGTSGTSVSFSAHNAISLDNQIPVIRCVRQYTGFSLKESKDAWDASRQGKTTVTIPDYSVRRDFINQLRALGCLVHE